MSTIQFIFVVILWIAAAAMTVATIFVARWRKRNPLISELPDGRRMQYDFRKNEWKEIQ